jgi:uncharacterized membrane protein YozB (DUF420 family)
MSSRIQRICFFCAMSIILIIAVFLMSTEEHILIKYRYAIGVALCLCSLCFFALFVKNCIKSRDKENQSTRRIRYRLYIVLVCHLSLIVACVCALFIGGFSFEKHWTTYLLLFGQIPSSAVIIVNLIKMEKNAKNNDSKESQIPSGL